MNQSLTYILGLQNTLKILIIKISVNEKIGKFIQENYFDDINYFKKKNKLEINIFPNNSLDISDYVLEFLSKTNKVLDKIEKISILKQIPNLKTEIKRTTKKK